MMELNQVLQDVSVKAVHGATAGVEVDTVTVDSRRVHPGSLFVAIRGTTGDGHQFISRAVEAGAVAVCGEQTPGDLAVPYIEVVDGRRAAAALAEAVHGFPSRALRLVGITGTNGKTSTAVLTQGICQATGLPAGVVGTVYYDVGAGLQDAPNTTPGPTDLSALLAVARDHGKQVVALEVSSHALDQERTAALEFDVAVFTNCTQDHLDYHGDMARYFAAKRRLFETLGAHAHKTAPKRAIVNADDGYATQVIDACAVPVWTYGIDTPADLRATRLTLTAAGTEADVETPAGTAALRLRLLGKHNASNALAALGAALALEVPLDAAVDALNAAPCVRGRCETVDAGQPFGVMVDYAHTPDGIRVVLETCRALHPRRLIVVFGCGGDRDRTKRPQMGELVARAADTAIVTSDNPRTEEPLAIMLDIEVGLQHAGRTRGEQYEMIPDRREAIARAITIAEPGDLVVIAGKGHETYQIVGTERHDFDDREVALGLLREHGGGVA